MQTSASARILDLISDVDAPYTSYNVYGYEGRSKIEAWISDARGVRIWKNIDSSSSQAGTFAYTPGDGASPGWRYGDEPYAEVFSLDACRFYLPVSINHNYRSRGIFSNTARGRRAAERAIARFEQTPDFLDAEHSLYVDRISPIGHVRVKYMIESIELETAFRVPFILDPTCDRALYSETRLAVIEYSHTDRATDIIARIGRLLDRLSLVAHISAVDLRSELRAIEIPERVSYYAIEQIAEYRECWRVLEQIEQAAGRLLACYDTNQIPANRVTVRDRVEWLEIDESHIDYALPQPWVDAVRASTGFDAPGSVVWEYPAGSFVGRPHALTAEAEQAIARYEAKRS